MLLTSGSEEEEDVDDRGSGAEKHDQHRNVPCCHPRPELMLVDGRRVEPEPVSCLECHLL